MRGAPNNLILAFALGTSLVLCINSGCSTATPPPPPAVAVQGQQRDASTTTGGNNGSGTDTSQGNGTNNTNNTGAAINNGGTDTASATGSGGGSGTNTSATPVPAAATSFTTGGASIGTDADKAAVRACLTKQTYYDRFANSGAGACTTDALAPVNCTNDGVQAILTASQKASYVANTTGTGAFVGWMIDQCVDCPPGNTLPACKKLNVTPDFYEAGTKVFFVQQVNTELSEQSLCLPVRPGQAALPPNSCTPPAH